MVNNYLGACLVWLPVSDLHTSGPLDTEQVRM